MRYTTFYQPEMLPWYRMQHRISCWWCAGARSRAWPAAATAATSSGVSTSWLSPSSGSGTRIRSVFNSVLAVLMFSPRAGASEGPNQWDSIADEQVRSLINGTSECIMYNVDTVMEVITTVVTKLDIIQGAAAEVCPVPHLLSPHWGSSNCSKTFWWDSQEIKCN